MLINKDIEDGCKTKVFNQRNVGEKEKTILGDYNLLNAENIMKSSQMVFFKAFFYFPSD